MVTSVEGGGLNGLLKNINDMKVLSQQESSNLIMSALAGDGALLSPSASVRSPASGVGGGGGAWQLGSATPGESYRSEDRRSSAPLRATVASETASVTTTPSGFRPDRASLGAKPVATAAKPSGDAADATVPCLSLVAGNVYAAAELSGTPGPVDKRAVATDLERHTELVHSLWGDLKSWRVETKQCTLSEEDAVILALRHMRHQVSSTAALSQLQVSLAVRLSALGTEMKEGLPDERQMTSVAFNLAGETQSLHKVMAEAIERRETAELAAAAAAAPRCLSVEDGYGESPLPRERQAAAAEEAAAAAAAAAAAEQAKASLEKQLQLVAAAAEGGGGDVSLSVDDLAQLLVDGGGGGAAGAAAVPGGESPAAHLLRKFVRLREDLGKKIASLETVVHELKGSEREKDAVHQRRVAQLLERVRGLEEENADLKQKRDTTKRKAESYAEAFGEYRDNMNKLRGRCDELIRENYDLTMRSQQSVQSMHQHAPSLQPSLQQVQPQLQHQMMPPRHASGSFPCTPDRQTRSSAWGTTATCDSTTGRFQVSHLGTQASPQSSVAPRALNDTSSILNAASPSPKKPVALEPSVEAPTPGLPRDAAASVDWEFNSLSFEMERKIANLGLQLASPQINDVLSLSPEVSDPTPKGMRPAQPSPRFVFRRLSHPTQQHQQRSPQGCVPSQSPATSQHRTNTRLSTAQLSSSPHLFRYAVCPSVLLLHLHTSTHRMPEQRAESHTCCHIRPSYTQRLLWRRQLESPPKKTMFTPTPSPPSSPFPTADVAKNTYPA